MIKDLKNSFMQAGFLTTIWVLGGLTFIVGNASVTLATVWHLIGIATLFAIVFGVLYPYVWHYATWIAPVTIVITTIANYGCGFGAVYLLSAEMFNLIKPYWLLILGLDLVGHIIAFYFYRQFQNKRLAKKLNQLR